MISILDKEKMKAVFNAYDANIIESITFVTGKPEVAVHTTDKISADNSPADIYVSISEVYSKDLISIVIKTEADTIALPEDMSYAFANMKSLKSIDMKSYADIDASHVVNMDHLCSKDSALERFDMSALRCNAVKDSSYAFSYCESLEEVNLGKDFDCLENCRAMFEQCHSLKELDLSPLFGKSEIKNSSYIAYKCENLENVKIGSGNLSFGMFSCCPNLEKIDVDLSELVSEIDTIVDAAALDSASPLAKELMSYVGDVVLE